jgi:hypothetical protein
VGWVVGWRKSTDSMSAIFAILQIHLSGVPTVRDF